MQEKTKKNDQNNWKKIVKGYSTPDEMKSWFQVANTLIPFFIVWYFAYKAIAISYFLTLALGIIGGALLIRTFIIMHDCGHGSFFKSKIKRDFIGYITGFLTFTPYHQWSNEHAIHHQTSGNLDKRGHGDVWTVTVREYEAMNWFSKLQYRLYRFPIVTFIIGPIYIFQGSHRFFKNTDGPKERQSVILCNLFLIAAFTLAHFTIGIKAFLMVHIPMTIIAQLVGVYLFYVQHQYEETYWETSKDWNYFDSAIKGSSYFKMNKVMQWVSGNIGFHHIHHLSHKIPNYKLEQCYNDNEMFQSSKIITWSDSIKCIWLQLYDEDEKRLITVGQYKKKYKKNEARDIKEELTTGAQEFAREFSQNTVSKKA